MSSYVEEAATSVAKRMGGGTAQGWRTGNIEPADPEVSLRGPP